MNRETIRRTICRQKELDETIDTLPEHSINLNSRKGSRKKQSQPRHVHSDIQNTVISALEEQPLNSLLREYIDISRSPLKRHSTMKQKRYLLERPRVLGTSHRNSSSRNPLYMPIELLLGNQTITTNALIDTGSTYSLLRQDIWKKGDCTPFQENPDPDLAVYSIIGESLTPKTIANIPFYHETQTYTQPFLVMEKLEYQVILGMDFLDRTNAFINIKDSIITTTTTSMTKSDKRIKEKKTSVNPTTYILLIVFIITTCVLTGILTKTLLKTNSCTIKPNGIENRMPMTDMKSNHTSTPIFVSRHQLYDKLRAGI